MKRLFLSFVCVLFSLGLHAQEFGCEYRVDKVDEFEGYAEKVLQLQSLFLSHHHGVWMSLSVELGSIDNKPFLIFTYKKRDNHGQPEVICVEPGHKLKLHLTDESIVELPYGGDDKECGEMFEASGGATDFGIVLPYEIPADVLTKITLTPMDIIRLEHREGHVDFELEEKLHHGLGGFDTDGHNHIHPQNYLADHMGCVVD